MTIDELENEIKNELEKLQSKLDELEKSLNDLYDTVTQNAQAANNIKTDM